MAAKISFNGYQFGDNGRPHYSRQARYEADAQGATPRRAIVTYTIAQTFKEDTFSDNQAKYWAMVTAIKSAPEGRLLIVGEFGNTLVDVLARPLENNLPDQWGQYLTETSVQFQAVEEISNGANAVASYEGGSVTLKNVSGWREAIRTERPTFAVDNRRETNGTVAASGKIVADPTQSEANRRTQLQTERDAIRSLADHKNVDLVFGTFDQTVRIDDVTADIKDGSYELDWNVTASYRRFPEGDYTETEYDVSTRDDLEKSERITSIRGKVRASAIESARTRVTEINDQYRSSTRTLRKTESTEQLIDGEDGAASNYNEVTFTTELRETIDIVNWSLNVTDKEDAKSGEILTTYSGKVTAINSGTALAKARELGAAAYPILLSSSETISTSQIGDDPLQFAEVTFSYEYARQGTLTYAEANGDTNMETFGQSTTTVSGFATAATQNDALTLARSFKPSSGLQLTAKETIGTVKGVNGSLNGTIFKKVEFSYVFFVPPAQGSVQSSKQVSKDYSTREITTTYSGTAYGASESVANGMIDPLVANAGRITKDERTTNRQKMGGNDVLISVTFSISFIAPLTQGTDDILEAEVTLSTTYSVDHAVITRIPYGDPYVQPNCGITPALKSVSGTIVAINAGTAQSWGRSMRALAIDGGYEDPPEEKMSNMYFPFSGTSIKSYRFAFTYAARFANLQL